MSFFPYITLAINKLLPLAKLFRKHAISTNLALYFIMFLLPIIIVLVHRNSFTPKTNLKESISEHSKKGLSLIQQS